MDNKKILASSIILLVLFFSNIGFAYTPEEADQDLVKARACIEEMNESNLSTQRVDDLYGQAEDFYEAQVIREEQNLSTNYDFVVSTSNQICNLKDEALTVHDELEALSFEVEEARKAGLEMEEINASYSSAKEAFESERYEEAEEHISNTYDKISEVEATTTKLRAFYEASTKTLRGFLRRNWKGIIVAIVVSSVVGLILKNQISIKLIERRIEHLKVEKETIYDLIKEVQHAYFEEQEMSESEYLTKINKFKEIIREINRQIPLLKTELEKKRKTFTSLKQGKILSLFKGAEVKKEKVTPERREEIQRLAEKLGGVGVGEKPKYKFKDFTIPQLKKVAEDQGVEIKSSDRKADIIKKIKKEVDREELGIIAKKLGLDVNEKR